jgi:glycosyltransferase involved in cell wall biosynthesis
MTKSKPRLAIVSSYGDYCPNATYAGALDSIMSKQFDCKVFDLQTDAIMKNPDKSLGDSHAKKIANEIKDFDIVNVHCELGLYGDELDDCVKRLTIINESAKYLIFTIHRWESEGNCFDVAYKRMVNSLAKGWSKRPFFLLTHLEKEKEAISNFFNIKNVLCYPVFYLNKEERLKYKKSGDSSLWKKDICSTDKAITIGLFGHLAPYKDYLTVFRALTLLPQEYKVVIFGGQQIRELEKNSVSPTIKKIIDFIDEYDLRKPMPYGERLADRTFFCGNQENDLFYKAMANTDYVVLPYEEGGQSASATLSLALELEKKIITTVNTTFLAYRKLFPDCFEMFNIGNHHELKNKILNYRSDKQDNLREQIKDYSFEKLADVYMDCYRTMKSSSYGDVIKDYRGYPTPNTPPRIIRRVAKKIIPVKAHKIVKELLS